MMHSPDLDVLKDIPGYKAILKAVLRSQIQLLVEQLADHTGEESVLLTANVSDGSLMHLGSESGKVFLEDHDEIKSQFLGFCLKRHHKRKAPEPPAPPVRRMVSDYPAQPEPRRSSMSSIVSASPSVQKRPRMSESFSAAQTSTPIHPVSVSRSAGRPQRPSQSPASIRNQSPSHTQSMADLAEGANGSTVKQEVSESLETQGTATETSKTLATEQTSEDSGEQTNIIKLEPTAESELDLEITGVEMGESSEMGFGQGDWSENVPYSQSGEGGQAEVEGYDSGSQSEFGNNQMRFPVKEMSYSIQEKSSEKLYRCEVCNKGFNHRGDWTRHLRVHTGEKPYKCDICQRAFSLKSNLKTHYVVHLNRQNMI